MPIVKTTLVNMTTSRSLSSLLTPAVREVVKDGWDEPEFLRVELAGRDENNRLRWVGEVEISQEHYDHVKYHGWIAYKGSVVWVILDAR